MKVAANEMLDQGIDVEPRMLVDMVTSTAADIAGLNDLGRLEVGRPADIRGVLAGLAEDPLRVRAGRQRPRRRDGPDRRRHHLRAAGIDDALAADVPAPNLRPVSRVGRAMRLLDNEFPHDPTRRPCPRSTTSVPT